MNLRHYEKLEKFKLLLALENTGWNMGKEKIVLLRRGVKDDIRNYQEKARLILSR